MEGDLFVIAFEKWELHLLTSFADDASATNEILSCARIGLTAGLAIGEQLSLGSSEYAERLPYNTFVDAQVGSCMGAACVSLVDVKAHQGEIELEVLGGLKVVSCFLEGFREALVETEPFIDESRDHSRLRA